MFNGMHTGIGRGPDDDAFQRRLVNLLYPTEAVTEHYRDAQGRPRGRHFVPEPYLGPNTRMLAYTHSNPRNTNIIDSSATGWNLQGLYSPRSNTTITGPEREQYERVFPNFAPHAGALNSAANKGTVSHEMLHRLQDVAPRELTEELERRLDGIFASVGRSGLSNSRLLGGGDASGAILELLPHAIEGFHLTPSRLLEGLGISRTMLDERVDGVPRSQIIAKQVRDLIEDVYSRSITSADYEQASTRLEPNMTRGRGRPAYQ